MIYPRRGAFRPSLSGARFVTENPATGRPLAEITAGDAADIDLAVRAARRAFDDGRWSRRSPAERRAVLLRFADLLEEAIRVARSIRAGTVSVNSYSQGDITTPFGGYKESGFGGRDKGPERFDQYTEKKTIWITLRA